MLLHLGLEQCFPIYFAQAGPFWLRKVTTNPHIIAYANIMWADYRYQKLIYMSEQILDRY